MRPVNKAQVPLDENGQAIVFKKYSRARRYLIDRIGEYCSYCERRIVVNLAIEHVKPKSINESLKLKWSNFLLACPNCNSTKGAKEINLDDYVWPDIDNTYPLFAYDESGVVKVSNELEDDEMIERVKNSIKLVGLDKLPPKEGSIAWEEASDRRFEHRVQAWKDAEEGARIYLAVSPENQRESLEYIKTIVIHQGFWSIWMRAFEGIPEVQQILIDTFPGTRAECFR